MRPRAEVFKAMVAEFPAELRERLAQAVTEAELRLLKEPKPTGPSDDELVALLKDKVRAERPDFTPASENKIVTLTRIETKVERERLAALLDRARRELAVEDHAEILASAATGKGVMDLVQEFGILQEDAARIIREIPATTDEEIRAEGRRFLLANPSGFPGPRALTDHLVAAFPTVQRRRIDDIVLELMQAEIGPSDSDLQRRAIELYDEALARPNLTGFPITHDLLFSVRGQVQSTMQREFADVSFERIALAIDAAERVILARPPREIVRPVFDETKIRRFVENKIDVTGTRNRETLVVWVLEAFGEDLDRNEIRRVVDEVLAATGVVLTDAQREQLEAEVETWLRRGTDKTTAIRALQEFVRRDDALPALSGDEAAEIVETVQSRLAAEITDVEVFDLAKELLAEGKSINEIVNILVRSVLAGDVVRANRIVGVLREEEAAIRAEGMASGRTQAVAARETLATIKADTAAEVAALTAEREALFEQIREIEQLAFDRPRDAGVIVRLPEEDAQIAALTDKVGETVEKRKAVVVEAKAKALDAVSVVQDPARQGDIAFVSKVDVARRATWQEGVDMVRRLVPPDVLDGLTTEIHARRGTRSQYRSGFGVEMAKGTSFDIVVHEIGHAIEFYRPEILQESIAWRNARTADLALEENRLTKLKKLFPNSSYVTSEVTRPDKFFDPYIGKDYGSANQLSEVLPMGLQEMARDPIGFAERDPDMFDFIFAVLRKVMDKNPVKRGRIP